MSFGIQGMVVGGKYLAGDGGGYDRVECLEINPRKTPSGCFGVNIRLICL